MVALVRFQRGFLGVILSGIVFALSIYWIAEIRNFFKGNVNLFNKFSTSGADLEEPWPYDLFDIDDGKLLIAKVPGPKKAVKVKSLANKLQIDGGQHFSKILIVSEKIRIDNVTYKNGILQVRFKEKNDDIPSMI